MVLTELAVANYDYDLNPGITHGFQNTARYGPLAESGVTNMHTCPLHCMKILLLIKKQIRKTTREVRIWDVVRDRGKWKEEEGERKKKKEKRNECFI